LKDLTKSALIALISIPISYVGNMMSMGLAHSDGFITIIAVVLLFPALCFFALVDKLGLNNISELALNTLALLVQYLAYLVVVHSIRLLFRSRGAAKP
jgi:hypothetical protein